MFYKYRTHKLGILIPLLSILFTACESKPKKKKRLLRQLQANYL